MSVNADGTPRTPSVKTDLTDGLECLREQANALRVQLLPVLTPHVVQVPVDKDAPAPPSKAPLVEVVEEIQEILTDIQTRLVIKS